MARATTDLSDTEIVARDLHSALWEDGVAFNRELANKRQEARLVARLTMRERPDWAAKVIRRHRDAVADNS